MGCCLNAILRNFVTVPTQGVSTVSVQLSQCWDMFTPAPDRELATADTTGYSGLRHEQCLNSEHM